MRRHASMFAGAVLCQFYGAMAWAAAGAGDAGESVVPIGGFNMTVASLIDIIGFILALGALWQMIKQIRLDLQSNTSILKEHGAKIEAITVDMAVVKSTLGKLRCQYTDPECVR